VTGSTFLASRSDDAPTITLTVRYFAAARAAADVDEESVTIDAPGTVASVIDAIGARHGQALTRVLTRCSYLLGSVAVRDPSAAVHAGDELDVLPPFAGG